MKVISVNNVHVEYMYLPMYLPSAIPTSNVNDFCHKWLFKNAMIFPRLFDLDKFK